MANPVASDGLKPLKITCTKSECDKDLHCFLPTSKMKATGQRMCRSCGAKLVDWKRVFQKDVNDAAYTFQALKYEWIRHDFWHREIDERAVAHARRKGWVGMRIAAEKRLRSSVGKAANTFFDGRQTPLKENALFYAQHATATCCRKCIEAWHGIPHDQELSEEEIAYFTQLLMLYVEDRLPYLTKDGEKIPRRRHKPKEES